MDVSLAIVRCWEGTPCTQCRLERALHGTGKCLIYCPHSYKYVPKPCFSLAPLTIDVQMVSMSYLQCLSPPYVFQCSVFQVGFHDRWGLGPPFYFWYWIDTVSCCLPCHIQLVLIIGIYLSNTMYNTAKCIVREPSGCDQPRRWVSRNSKGRCRHQSVFIFLQTKPAGVCIPKGNLRIWKHVGWK